MASSRPPRPGNNKISTPKTGSSTSTPARKPPSASSASAAGRRPSKAPPPPPEGGIPPILLLGGILLIFAIALVAILVLPGLSNNNSASSGTGGIPIGPDATAKVDTFPNQGQQHINVGQQHEPYNSDPPTSGPHYATPDLWGVYDKTQADETLVHNLEHGGIVIQYDCPTACGDVINQLSNYARRYPANVFTGILLAPRKLPNDAKISLTAWQHRLLLKSLDTDKINSFIATYFNKAPESAG